MIKIDGTNSYTFIHRHVSSFCGLILVLNFLADTHGMSCFPRHEADVEGEFKKKLYSSFTWFTMLSTTQQRAIERALLLLQSAFSVTGEK